MPSTVIRERSVSYRYAPELTCARQARADVSETLFRWGLGCHADEAELIVSELIANAVRHGEGPVETRISTEGFYLHIEVHDGGRGRPVWREAGAEDESGRGLTVIYGLLDLHGGSFGVEEDADGHGKTVDVSLCLASQ